MLRTFDPMDLVQMEVQPSQALDTAGRERILKDSARRGPCWTYEAGGRVLAVGGLAMLHPAWATAWTILAGDIGARMVGLTRAVSLIVRDASARLGPDGRLDMHVDPQSVASVRWAIMLGFGPEAYLERALPGGRALTVWLYKSEGSAGG